MRPKTRGVGGVIKAGYMCNSMAAAAAKKRSAVRKPALGAISFSDMLPALLV